MSVVILFLWICLCIFLVLVGKLGQKKSSIFVSILLVGGLCFGCFRSITERRIDFGLDDSVPRGPYFQRHQWKNVHKK